MRNKFIVWIRIIIFILFGLVFFLTIENIFLIKFNYPINNDGISRTIEGLYQLDEDSIDVIFLGTSHISSGISPMEIYEKTNITSYNLGTSLQPIEGSYYLLKESIKKQNPKVIVYDVSSLFFEEKQSLGWRYLLDSMPLSNNKYRLSMEYVRTVPKSESLVSVLLPIYKYHLRWNELKMEDFINLNNYNITKGYYMRSQLNPSIMNKSDMNLINEELINSNSEDTIIYENNIKYNIFNNSELRYTEIAEDNLDYLLKMKKICDDNQINLILTKIPNMFNPVLYKSAWTQDRYYQIKGLSEELGLVYLDFLYDVDLGIDWLHDTSDGGIHLNLNGAIKISDYVAGYLNENYILDKKVNLNYDNDLTYYNKLREVAFLETETNLTEYLKKLYKYDGNLILYLAGQKDITRGLSEEDIDILSAFGIEIDFSDITDYSYIAIIDENEKLYEEASNRNINYDNRIEDIDLFKLTSGGTFNSASASIKLNSKEYALNSDGLHIVVYDKEAQMIIDTVVFTTSSKEYTTIRDNDIIEKFLRKYENYLLLDKRG